MTYICWFITSIIMDADEHEEIQWGEIQRVLAIEASIPVELRCTTLLTHKCTHQLEVPQACTFGTLMVASSVKAGVINHELNSPPHLFSLDDGK